MKCPKCSKEMKDGFVRPTGNGGICWTNENVGFGAPMAADGFFRIGPAPYLKGASTPAFNCEFCKLILIDYGAIE